MRPPVRPVALLVAVAAVLASCGEDEPVATGAGPGGVELADEYVAVEVTAGGEPRPLVPGTELRLTFDDDRLGASLGCNQMGGPFEVDGTRLVVEQLETTEMGCEPALHDQDRWFADFVTSRPQLLTSGDEIQLNDGFTAVVLRDADVAAPDLPLLGTTWEVDGFVEGTGPEGTAMSIAVERPGTLRLTDELVAVGFDGCAELAEPVPFALDGDRLTFPGSAPAPAAGCEGAAAEHADRYRSVLTGAVTWSVDGDRLTLVAEDGRGATYRAGS